MKNKLTYKCFQTNSHCYVIYLKLLRCLILQQPLKYFRHHCQLLSQSWQQCLHLTRIEKFQPWSNLFGRLFQLFQSIFLWRPENFNPGPKFLTRVELLFHHSQIIWLGSKPLIQNFQPTFDWVEQSFDHSRTWSATFRWRLLYFWFFWVVENSRVGSSHG